MILRPLRSMLECYSGPLTQIAVAKFELAKSNPLLHTPCSLDGGGAGAGAGAGADADLL
jgi:hypothetical protein